MKFRVLDFLRLAVCYLLLSACGERAATVPAPQEITEATLCALDGMPLADHPGPKAQIHYDDGAPEFYCDTVELFSVVLQPGHKRRVRALYVQDMARADWSHPSGHWIDARDAFYVSDSGRRGSMGATFASFGAESAAHAFAAKHGGKVMRFGDVTPDMAALDGGALHDSSM